MNQYLSTEFEYSAIAQVAWRPGLPGSQGRAFHLADRDHLPGVGFGQFASAGRSSAAADLRQILSNFLLRFRHFEVRQFCIISRL